MRDVLVFTVALNGYAGAYQRCLESQRSYCRRQGFRHVAVTRPLVVRDVAITAWLKVTLLRDALASGYEWVAFVDSDAAVAGAAPDFTTSLGGDHDVYMAMGRSGRLNSGVILARNTESARAFTRRVVGSLTETVDQADRVGVRYENGNIIACARKSEAVGVMDARWNNTYQRDLDDHIRHYTGDLRGQYLRSRPRAAVFRARRALAGAPGSQPERRGAVFVSHLEGLTRLTLRRYPGLLSGATAQS